MDFKYFFKKMEANGIMKPGHHWIPQIPWHFFHSFSLVQYQQLWSRPNIILHLTQKSLKSKNLYKIPPDTSELEAANWG